MILCAEDIVIIYADNKIEIRMIADKKREINIGIWDRFFALKMTIAFFLSTVRLSFDLQINPDCMGPFRFLLLDVPFQY
jgi:uncharacterized metal-binding protein